MTSLSFCGVSAERKRLFLEQMIDYDHATNLFSMWNDCKTIFNVTVTGTLKGYDQLLNLVLDEAVEFLRDPEDPLKTTDQTRQLGLIVCRGTAVMLVSPTDGTDEIPNPFLQPDGA